MRPWWKFEERFGGTFMMSVPSGFAYTKGRKTLLIPDEEGELALALELMKRSLQEEKDLLEERYKDNVFKPEKGVLY